MNISQLKEISAIAIQHNPDHFTDEQRKLGWLGYQPATTEAIEAAEQKLGVALPGDYKQFLLITNGFFTTSDSTELTFAPVEEIDYLKNIDDFIVEVWSDPAIIDVGEQLIRSIIIGGINDEQYFLLIPNDNESIEWTYWKFASWIPGAHPYKNLDDYFTSTLEFLKKEC
ncbi:SMI1/KNR4 family protein [Mucilaginibacter terrae]|uniref:Cell wall assembly regulator SMI1 n=1 Tax=Mucilaginibacter terrae TaxID=1955052 RepID=A0ABU3GQN8_9SPHI|nr:SMI1/KNR4 family protein [Mucilaginibacter terrae]MDT3402105.1 cell wall assembly regulator SMI1 [Mucilaginibacter terrae]